MTRAQKAISSSSSTSVLTKHLVSQLDHLKTTRQTHLSVCPQIFQFQPTILIQNPIRLPGSILSRNCLGLAYESKMNTMESTEEPPSKRARPLAASPDTVVPSPDQPASADQPDASHSPSRLTITDQNQGTASQDQHVIQEADAGITEFVSEGVTRFSGLFKKR